MTRREEESTREAPSLPALGLHWCCHSNNLLPWKQPLVPGSASWCQAYPHHIPSEVPALASVFSSEVWVPVMWSQGPSSPVLDLARQIGISYTPRLTCSYFCAPFFLSILLYVKPITNLPLVTSVVSCLLTTFLGLQWESRSVLLFPGVLLSIHRVRAGKWWQRIPGRLPKLCLSSLTTV